MTPEEKRDEMNAKRRARYATDPEVRRRALEKTAAWRKANPGAKRAYDDEHIEENGAYQRMYRETHREQISAEKPPVRRGAPRGKQGVPAGLLREKP